MRFKFLALSLMLLSVLFAFPLTSRASSAQDLGPGPTTYVIATIAGGPQTVDPAMAYDTASGELIANVYDTLIAFRGTSTSEFVPWLASSYTISPDGQTYQFMIRQNVPWQNASYGFVSPADAAYSLQKVLVRDYTGGPAWMLWLAIFGIYAGTDYGNLTNPAVATALGNAIANAITYDATSLTIHFQTGKAYLPFLGILANTWGCIQSEAWDIAHGDWNPAVDKLSDGTWVRARDPYPSPLDAPSGPSTTGFMMGSGPFKFDFLNLGIEWSIVRNTAFWGGWGATRGSLLGIAAPSLGYLDRITEYFISSYATRLAGFTGVTPIYDSIAVPRVSISTVWQQPGIRCTYPLQSQAIDAMFFSYNVSMLSPYIESPTNSTYFGQNGIRPDFFSDVHVRRAVAYSFDWSQYIATAYLGEAQQPILPLPVWDAFYNSSLTGYGINTAKAVEEWKLAWGGQVWANGFYFDITYNAGSIPRQAVAQMIKAVLESENPLFHVRVVQIAWSYGLPWGLDGRSVAPIFIAGWLLDYPDADDWVTPFLQSTDSTFAYPQHIEMDPYSGLMDNLIKNARYNATFEGRNANYQQLWKLYIQEAPSVPLEEAYNRRWERDWVQGWYYNPAYPGVYGYTMWKQALPREDITEDGMVDIKDLATAALAYGSYFIQSSLPPYPVGPAGYYTPNWNSRADVNVVNLVTGGRSDMKVDIKDLADIATHYGYVAPAWQPLP